MPDRSVAARCDLGLSGALPLSRRGARVAFRVGLALGMWIAVSGCLQSAPAGSAADDGPDWTIERTRPIVAEEAPAIAAAPSLAEIEARAADDEIKREGWRRIGRFFRGAAHWMEAAFLYPPRQPR